MYQQYSAPILIHFISDLGVNTSLQFQMIVQTASTNAIHYFMPLVIVDSSTEILQTDHPAYQKLTI